MAKSPDAFRTISEVSSRLDTPAHVLRFWESKFSQIKPIKRAGARRYYRPEDVLLLAGIKSLLHEQGMTIKGAQKLLREKGVKHVQAIGEGEGTASTTIEVAEKAPAAKPVVEPEPVTPKLEISNITAFRPAVPVDAKLGLPENPAPRDEMPPRFFSQRDDAAEAAIKAKSAEILPLLAKLETVRDRMLRS